MDCLGADPRFYRRDRGLQGGREAALGHHFCRCGGLLCLLYLEAKIGSVRAEKSWGDQVEMNCSRCGTPYEQGDLFCRKCGARVISTPQVPGQVTPFEMELKALLKTIKEFRAWIDQKKRKNVRFMRAYKERIEGEIRPSINEFDEKYRETEEGQSPLFHLIMESFSWLSRPIGLMETELRPSVGMGVFLERWMVTKAAEDYLKECCQEADQRIDELTKEIGLD